MNTVLLNQYSHKRQSVGSNLFRPKSATLTLIPHSWWHRPLCSSKICATHNHDKPQISPNCFFSYMLMEFIAPPIGWAQHALVGRFPVPLSAYPPGFVMIGQRVSELWPIISKPFCKNTWVPSQNLALPNLVWRESIFQKLILFYCFSHYAN